MQGNRVYCLPGFLAVYGQSLNAEQHQHHAIQVIWPLRNSKVRIEDDDYSGALIIAEGVPHALDMEQGWLLLIEPKSALGYQLSVLLESQACVDVSAVDLPQPSQPEGEHIESCLLALMPLFQQFGIESLASYVVGSFEPEGLDTRIQQLMRQFDQCLNQECLKPDHWRAAEVATQFALSESRFLHLFREQMGIAWRPYLLWRRLLCAVNMIRQGSNATDAAHRAGFADSAHLSRTFVRMFGMRLRDAKSALT